MLWGMLFSGTLPFSRHAASLCSRLISRSCAIQSSVGTGQLPLFLSMCNKVVQPLGGQEIIACKALA